MKKYKIGIFTASTPIASFSPERAKRAIAFLENLGHEVILGELFWHNQLNYRAGSAKARAKEINNLLKHDVDILMSAIGGFNSFSLVPYLDYKLFKAKNPIIVGFSDSTPLLNAILHQIPRAKVIYGPSLFPNYGEFELESAQISWNHFLTAIEKQEFILQALDWTYGPPENWETFEKDRLIFRDANWKIYNTTSKPITGIIWGGNIEALISMFESPYLTNFKQNGILFLEDDTKVYANVERNFNSLYLAGYFNNVKAIILGKYNNFRYTEAKVHPVEILLELLNGKNIPILYDVDISHCKPMLSLPLNQQATIDFTNQTIHIKKKW
ncbi:S66 family peptidase [Candidatus Mycoplasma pogonae]